MRAAGADSRGDMLADLIVNVWQHLALAGYYQVDVESIRFGALVCPDIRAVIGFAPPKWGLAALCPVPCDLQAAHRHHRDPEMISPASEAAHRHTSRRFQPHRIGSGLPPPSWRARDARDAMPTDTKCQASRPTSLRKCPLTRTRSGKWHVPTSAAADASGASAFPPSPRTDDDRRCSSSGEVFSTKKNDRPIRTSDIPVHAASATSQTKREQRLRLERSH